MIDRGTAAAYIGQWDVGAGVKSKRGSPDTCVMSQGGVTSSSMEVGTD